MKERIIKIVSISAVVAITIALIVIAWWYQSQEDKEQEELAFRSPTGLLMTDEGTLYVSDGGLHVVLTLSGIRADQVAGRILPQVGGSIPGAYSDGTAAEALFNEPSAMAEWLDGIVISDTGNNRLRFLKNGVVQTLAGTGVQGCENGNANDATFYKPKGLSVGEDGALYVADSGNGCIRRISENGSVETVLTGLNTPSGLCWDGGVLYIADAGLNQILCWDEETLTVLAGLASGVYPEDNAGFEDGEAENASFRAPQAVLAKDGTVYVADTGNSAVRKICDGKVETLASFDGTGGELWPAAPSDLAWVNGTLYVADSFAGIVFTVYTR